MYHIIYPTYTVYETYAQSQKRRELEQEAKRKETREFLKWLDKKHTRMCKSRAKRAERDYVKKDFRPILDNYYRPELSSIIIGYADKYKHQYDKVVLSIYHLNRMANADHDYFNGFDRRGRYMHNLNDHCWLIH